MIKEQRRKRLNAAKSWRDSHKKHLREYNKNWYTQNRDTILKHTKQRYRQLKHVRDRRHFCSLSRTLKVCITSKFCQTLLRKQNYRCAICRAKKPGVLTKRFALDHCHKTNKIRGFLCRKCNVALGSFDDSVKLLKSAIRYLKRFA